MRTLSIVSFLIVALTGWVASPAANCTDPVNIPDANLVAALQDALGSYDAITCAELESLENFQAPGRGINNVEGLQHAVNLRDLDLDENAINDLSPFSGASFPSMLFVYLRYNQITDIGPLAGLSSAHYLLLSGNPIGDYSVLADFDTVYWLALAETGMGSDDLIYLANLNSVGSLDLARNSISDLTAIGQLPNLHVLQISDNPVSRLPEFNCPNLAVLNAYDCAISDITGLQGAPNLESIRLTGNSVRDISVLENLVALEYVKLDDNRIREIDALADNPGIGQYDVVKIPMNCLDASDFTVAQQMISRGVEVHFYPQKSCPYFRKDVISYPDQP